MNDAKEKSTKLTPVTGSVRTAIDKTRKALRSEQGAESLMGEGFVRIEPITGLDIVPNKIKSTPPDHIMVRPQECYVNRDYQRNLSRKSMNLIHKIVTDWDWAKYKPLVLTRDEQERYIIIDGQHTAIAAATHPDVDKIPAMFIPLADVEEQARSFIGHNTARVPVANLDLYHAKITAGDELAVTADRIMHDYGIVVVRSVQGRNHSWQTNQTMASAVAMKILDKHGKAKFTSIVEFLSKCGFSPIRADHWRFAEALLVGSRVIYTPSLMIEVIKSINASDAISAAQKIASDTEVSVYQGLLVYYKNRYNEVYRIR